MYLQNWKGILKNIKYHLFKINTILLLKHGDENDLICRACDVLYGEN